MVVLIDPPQWTAHGRRWSHLISDTSTAELHAFARRLGIPERGFEGDHYDLPEERYPAAVAAGALPVSSRELLRRLRASGLRRPKRRGERVLISGQVNSPGRVDLLLSAKPPLGPVSAVHLLAWSEHAVVCLPDGVGLTLPSARVPVVDGDPAALARSLAAAVLGDGRVELTWRLAQVGYLRRVQPPASAVGVTELVLALRWSGAPAAPACWVRLAHAMGLLPVLLAPLVRQVVAGPPTEG